MRDFRHPEVAIFDNVLVPRKCVFRTKIVFLITVSENHSYVLWFEVTNSFHTHLQYDIISFLRPIASLEKQNGQCEWLGTCSDSRVFVEPVNPVSRVDLHHVIEAWGINHLKILSLDHLWHLGDARSLLF